MAGFQTGIATQQRHQAVAFDEIRVHDGEYDHQHRHADKGSDHGGRALADFNFFIHDSDTPFYRFSKLYSRH